MAKTLLDVLKEDKSDKVLEAVDSVGITAPETISIPVTKIDGIKYTVSMPASLPKVGMRPANSGIEAVSSRHIEKENKLGYIDGAIEIDKAVVSSAKDAGRLMAKETRTVTQGALFSLGLRTWYQDPASDSTPPVSAQMGDYMTISADSTKRTDNDANRNDTSGASAYLVIHGDDYLHYVYGRNTTLAMSPIKEQSVSRLVAGTNKIGTMEALCSRIQGWVGIAVDSPFAVVRIKNISDSNPLTDKLVAEALSLFPASHKGMVSAIYMNRTTKLGLQKSRTVAPVTAGDAQMIGNDPDKVMGIKIIETDTLLDSETADKVAAVFAESEYTFKKSPLATK